MRTILDKALAETAPLWSEIERATAWVAAMGRALRNDAGEAGSIVRRRVAAIVAAMARHRGKVPTLDRAVAHLLKVTKSYWSGLFHCYDVEGMERTNNCLEQTFGKWRHRQRRCTGRKTAARTTVLRGPVSLVAMLATAHGAISAATLAQTDREAFIKCRLRLRQRQHPRVLGRRFRTNPGAYLKDLEKKAIKLTLPA